MAILEPLCLLSPGSYFQVPGDTRFWELVRLSVCAAAVRPARGFGQRKTVVDPITGETHNWESRNVRTISRETLCQAVPDNLAAGFEPLAAEAIRGGQK